MPTPGSTSDDLTTQSPAGARPASLLSIAGLRTALAELAGLAECDLGDHDDLIGSGIDSLSIMKISSLLRVAGVSVKTAELMEAPTLADWMALIDSQRGPAEGAAPADVAPIDAVDPSAPFPLATMQHAYWVGRMPGHPLAVASHFYCEFDAVEPGLDPSRLEQAAWALTARHPMLRARFGDDGRQQVLAQSPWRGVTVHDLRRPGADAEAELAGLRLAESNRRLDVEAGEVFDLQVSLLPGGGTRLHVNVDMLVADALSFRIMLDELAALSAEPDIELPPLDYDVAQYLARLPEVDIDELDEARAYWQERVVELPEPPQLPLAVAPEDLTAPAITRYEHWISEADHRRLGELARRHGVTVSMALATAYAEVLGRWSAEPCFTLNLPLFDRRPLHPDVGRLVGDFTTLLLLGVDVGGDISFADRARDVQTRLRADLRHSRYSGLDVLRDVARLRTGAVPSAPVVFTSALGLGDLFGERVRGHFGSLAWMISQTAQVWLDHQVTEDDGRLLLNWDAVHGLFAPGVVEAMFAAYVDLIEWLLGPEADWTAVPPAALNGDQAASRARANDTEGPVRTGGLHDAFFARATAAPDAPAVLWASPTGTGRLSYGELAQRADDLARRLQRRSVSPGEAVAITVPKGPGQIEAVLGVLRTGAAYVPVGVDLPTARRNAVYARAGVRLVITAPGAPPTDLPAGLESLVLGEGDPGPQTPLVHPEADGESVAYVIFTSGSTGEPKGVMIPHRAGVNSVEDLNARTGLGPADRVLAVSALDFDLSVYDLFGVLSVGGAVVTINEDDRRDATRWAELVRRFGVTVWQSVPALLDMVLVAAEDGDPLPLRLALVGGDWPGLDLADRLGKGTGGIGRLVALGGTTETTIHSTWFEVERVDPEWASVPWGSPLRNVRARVADERGRDRPDWVPGELWIGGRSVGLGYRGDAELTAAVFVTHDAGPACPASGPTDRWYRTGDIARYWPDGTLEFLGRRDHQIKVRGHRIELGDVEAAFVRHPHIDRATAAGLGDAGHRELAVAVVGRGDAGIDVDVVRRFVAGLLPSPMVPERIVVLDRLPLTDNGKVDRAAIARRLAAERDGVRSDAADLGDQPAGPVEEALADIWRELIGAVPTRSQSFFAAGGDSLLATRLVQDVRRRLGVEIPLRQLFETPTIAGLAAAVGDQDRDHGSVEEGVL